MTSDITSKKILFLITKSNFGGAQRYVLELATALKHGGCEVAVACGGNGELFSRLRAVGIKTYQIKGAERDISFLKEIQALFSIAQIIRSYDPDILHLNSSKVGLLGAFIGRMFAVPKIIFTAHGWPFLEPRKLSWRIMAWVGSYLTAIFSHRVILVSENDLTQTKMPWITSKCTVIHTAVQTFPVVTREEARAALLPKEIIDARCQDIWLVTHGEINRNKNHVTAIDAVAEFNSTHSTKIFYNIIGEGDLIGTLKEQVDLKGLNEYVHFTGYLAEARQYLLAFDIYLISSKKEGLPYSLLEAGLSGLPCIASNVGGIPEVIVDKSTGLLINPDNHMSIVAALDFLFTNTDKRSAYSKNLSEHIDKNFSLGEMIEKTKAVYAL